MKKILILAVVFMFAACGSSVQDRSYQMPDLFTRSKVKVRAENGVTVSADAMAAIDSGLAAAFDRARCNGYTLGLKFTNYTVLVVKGEPDSGGLPAFRILTDAYKGTEFDKGGYILAAGQFFETSSIAVAEHTSHFDHLATTVGYEAEHKILFDNAPAEYERTKVHGLGAGHPLIPSCN